MSIAIRTSARSDVLTHAAACCTSSRPRAWPAPKLSWPACCAAAIPTHVVQHCISSRSARQRRNARRRHDVRNARHRRQGESAGHAPAAQAARRLPAPTCSIRTSRRASWWCGWLRAASAARHRSATSTASPRPSGTAARRHLIACSAAVKQDLIAKGHRGRPHHRDALPGRPERHAADRSPADVRAEFGVDADDARRRHVRPSLAQEGLSRAGPRRGARAATHAQRPVLVLRRRPACAASWKQHARDAGIADRFQLARLPPRRARSDAGDRRDVPAVAPRAVRPGVRRSGARREAGHRLRRGRRAGDHRTRRNGPARPAAAPTARQRHRHSPTRSSRSSTIATRPPPWAAAAASSPSTASAGRAISTGSTRSTRGC